ncbi:MAG: hypothetical protein RDV41_09555, partial [Planctomycetota bacterium]|nr:hypothetical protein [Planctomycetota bacterium]
VFDQPKERRLWGNNCVVLMIKTKADWHRWVDATTQDEGQRRISKECCGQRLGEPGGVIALEMMGGNQASLEQMALHMIGHHILDFWDRKSDHVPVWIEEGFASYIEFEVAKDVGSSCIGGGTAANPAENKWRDGADWKGLLKDAVMNGKDKEAGSNLTWDAIRRTRDYNSMAHSQRAKSWSLITFLISLDNKKFQTFIKEMKGMEKGDWQAQDKAIQKAYEMTYNDLETEWRKYVTKEY